MYKHTGPVASETNQRLAQLGYIELIGGSWVLTTKGRLATEADLEATQSLNEQRRLDQQNLRNIVRDAAE